MHSSVTTTVMVGETDDRQARRFDSTNVLVLAAQCAAWAGCLTLARIVQNAWALVALLVFFCFMMQGVFSMMHECFHRHAHRDARINYAMCWLASAMFGASATLIWVNHLGHHVRNRTSAELVDYVEPGQSIWRKTVAYYSAIFGGIWLAAWLGSIAISLVPSRWTQRLTARGRNNTYAAAFADFTPADFQRIRWETMTAAAFWALLWLSLRWQWQHVLSFYAAFAFSWSSLQWIYHVRTPLHPVEGTYNLRAPRLIRWLFLNFNYNLTHHRQPALRWQLMHGETDLRQTRPLWFNWLSILLPPRRLPPPSHLTKTYF